MKTKSLPLTLLLSFLVFNVYCQNTTGELKLWFTKPAENWNEALPVGNGRLGAMVFGGIEKERLQLNEESVWTGQPRWDANPEALKNLPKVRQLLFEGKYKDAEKLAQGGILGSFRRDDASSYQTLGDLTINFGSLRGVSNYRRELDIEKAIATVKYTTGQVNFTREIFSSAPDQSLVVRLTADKPGSLTFTLKLTRPGSKASITAEGNEVIMKEHVGDGIGVKMEAKLKLNVEGGKIAAVGDSIRIEKANSVTVFLTAATDYFGKDPAEITKTQIESVAKRSYTDIKKDHITDYQSYFNRVSIDLGSSHGSYFTSDARLTAMQNGYADTDLIELYYQFGRYLLISSSRPGDLPANLQGIWADGLRPP